MPSKLGDGKPINSTGTVLNVVKHRLNREVIAVMIQALLRPGNGLDKFIYIERFE